MTFDTNIALFSPQSATNLPDETVMSGSVSWENWKDPEVIMLTAMLLTGCLTVYVLCFGSALMWQFGCYEPRSNLDEEIPVPQVEEMPEPIGNDEMPQSQIITAALLYR